LRAVQFGGRRICEEKRRPRLNTEAVFDELPTGRMLHVYAVDLGGDIVEHVGPL